DVHGERRRRDCHRDRARNGAARNARGLSLGLLVHRRSIPEWSDEWKCSTLCSLRTIVLTRFARRICTLPSCPACLRSRIGHRVQKSESSPPPPREFAVAVALTAFQRRGTIERIPTAAI